MKRGGKLKARASNETNDVKDRIQALVREIVIARDGGCVFRWSQWSPVPPCNGYAKDGHLILQADHLVTRANSATYADTRLIVCVCRGHHFWKTYNKERYDEIVRSLIGPERCALWSKMHDERYIPRRKFTYDWRKDLAALRQELRQYENQAHL
jgi:hypothetical protein